MLLLLFMLLPQRSAGIPLPYCLHVLHACMLAALFRVDSLSLSLSLSAETLKITLLFSASPFLYATAQCI